MWLPNNSISELIPRKLEKGWDYLPQFRDNSCESVYIYIYIYIYKKENKD